MFSIPDDTNDQMETRMADFEVLDRKLAMGPQDSSSDRIDDYYGDYEGNEGGHLKDLEYQSVPVQSAQDYFEDSHDNFDTTSQLSDLSSLDGPLFVKVVEDMFLEADFSMFVHQNVFDD